MVHSDFNYGGIKQAISETTQVWDSSIIVEAVDFIQADIRGTIKQGHKWGVLRQAHVRSGKVEQYFGILDFEMREEEKYDND